MERQVICQLYLPKRTCAMEIAARVSETAVARRISLALRFLAAAQGDCRHVWSAADGPWDVKAVASAGRLANHLALLRGILWPCLQASHPETYR